VTTDTSWVRVVPEAGSDGERGSGFLVDDRRVLTCHHVARGPRARVWFPILNITVGADVRRPDAGVDLAVLTLDEAVPFEPARIAPYGVMDVRSSGGLPELNAFGFPNGFEDLGFRTRFRAVNHGRDADGMVQVQPLTELDMPLGPGFSGAAACLAAGPVVGMVMQADPAGNGRILPMDTIRRAWPDVDDLVHLDEIMTPGAYGRLHTTLDGLRLDPAARPMLDQMLYERGDVLAGTLIAPSLIAAVGYLATEASRSRAFRSGLVYEFIVRAKELTDDRGRTALAEWLRHHWPHATVEPAVVREQELATGSVIVYISPKVDTVPLYHVEIQRVDGEQIVRKREAPERPLRREEIRPWVEKELCALLRPLGRQRFKDYLIQFAVPPSWWHERMEDWSAYYDVEHQCGPDASDHDDDCDVSLGYANPVTLRDQGRFDLGPSDDDRDSWAKLLESRPPLMKWFDCRESSDRKRLHGWLRLVEPLAAAFAGVEAERILVAAGHPVPVVVWSREPCRSNHTDHEGQPCRGFGFRMVADVILRDKNAEDLPKAIRMMRLGTGGRGDPANHGAEVALIWEDPYGLPDDGLNGTARARAAR
jgi:hypothetical protein